MLTTPSARSDRLSISSTGLALGDLHSGRAFDNGCTCYRVCVCEAPRLAAQLAFTRSLLDLGVRLASLSCKEQRTRRLHAEFALLNMNLPARVFLPVHARGNGEPGHIVVRVPPTAAVCLNSKDKVWIISILPHKIASFSEAYYS